MLSDLVAALLMSCGLIFFTAGTIGLIRFPDVRSQLHALTKADNLGLELLLVWLLTLGSSSISAQALAGAEADTLEGGGDGARTL
jgi:multicomponent Na+:H+ antiporter subunit G